MNKENTNRIVKIYGYSDDTVIIDDEAEILSDSYDSFGKNWSAVLEDSESGQKAIVYVTYTNKGTWVPALGVFDEDEPFPEWGIRIYHDSNLCDYSTVLQLFMPETVILTQL